MSPPGLSSRRCRSPSGRPRARGARACMTPWDSARAAKAAKSTLGPLSDLVLGVEAADKGTASYYWRDLIRKQEQT